MAAKDVKKIEDLTLGDEYLFEAVMQNKKLCKRFIETFLEIPDITDIEYINTEETYQHSYRCHSIVTFVKAYALMCLYKALMVLLM